MITIYDIAKKAGCSAATVSRVLNGYPDVSQATRDKIMRITQELNYQPSAAARGLATKRTWTIGVFFQDHVNSGFRHPFLQEVLESFKHVMGGKGYDLLFFANNMLDKELEGFEARARHRNVDGLLLLGVPRSEPSLADLASSRIPCVSVDLDLLGPRAAYICSDNLNAIKKGMQHLYDQGHRRIAFIGDRYSTKPGHDRLLGYQQSLQELGLPFHPGWLAYGDFTEEGGYNAAVSMLQQEEVPTAIFAAGDMMAIGAIHAIRNAGLQVARDISVLGFDDIALARHMGLSTIAQRKEELGRRAAECLIQLINDPAYLPSVEIIETDLIQRDSVQKKPL